jgi:hypothetical protein
VSEVVSQSTFHGANMVGSSHLHRPSELPSQAFPTLFSASLESQARANSSTVRGRWPLRMS